VLILTHRIELCRQTSATLKALGIRNKIISSQVKAIAPQDPYKCYVAMVETVHHRIESGAIDLSDIGLVIIDEAHYNAFQKLYAQFEHARIIGVTATPFSSDTERPMRDVYRELLVGESIGDLIAQGYLAKPANWRYDVELNTLQTGAGGDFTVASSDALYSSPAMLELLLHALAAHARNKKTLIFNQGIFASKTVCHSLSEAGYPVKHLDNETSADERKEILRWFKRTKGAILSSVSILTTGFDEPTVQAVVLNRATTSLTLYHQMIGPRRAPPAAKENLYDYRPG
jgi:superfamily II DNA or RNA helicase